LQIPKDDVIAYT